MTNILLLGKKQKKNLPSGNAIMLGNGRLI